MLKSITLVVVAATLGSAQGVTAVLSPTASAPAGCATSYSGTFEITAVNITKKRDISARGIEKRDVLTLTLDSGVLTDAKGRTGYIAENHQFQFDEPPQTGAIYTAGWSVCTDGSLALGGSTTFYTCASGNPDGSDDGSFYNIYDDQAFDICQAAELKIIAGSTSGVVSQQSDGQVTASPIAQISDGQIQQPTGVPITQISDGQVQVPTQVTGVPITQISDGQIQAPTATTNATTTGPAISQISDGQIQAPTGSNLTATSTPVPFEGTATSVKAGVAVIFAAVLAVVLL